MSRFHWRMIFPFLLLLSLPACVPTAAVVWSPDGNRAVYTVIHDQSKPMVADAMMIDRDGKVLAKLGRVGFGNNDLEGAAFGCSIVAWSGDSKFAYLATSDPTPGSLAVAKDWTPVSGVDPDDNPQLTLPTGTVSAAGDDAKNYGAAIVSWDGSAITPVVKLPGLMVVSLRLAPDQQWLALATIREHAKTLELYAYAVRSKKLYRVDAAADFGFCFTGPHRLVFVRLRPGGTAMPAMGQIIETDLDETTDTIQSAAILNVLPHQSAWFAATPAGSKVDGILFMACPAKFPSKPPATSTNPPSAMSLYRWDRATGEVAALADQLLGMRIRPDGGAILCLRQESDKLSLEIADANGEKFRKLKTMEIEDLALTPTWHGSDRITMIGNLIGNEEMPNGNRKDYSVVDTPVKRDLTLGASTELSRDWPAADRPWITTLKAPTPVTASATTAPIKDDR
jgi:hypothetical protein